MKHAIPEHAILRPGTVDRDIWVESVELNLYHLPDLFQPGDCVLNIGAHTGSVVWRCVMGGADVVAIEPAQDNYRVLIENVRPVRDRVVLVNAAAWRSDQPAVVLRYDANWQPCNTGGGCVMGDAGGVGHSVLGIPLDDLLRLRPGWRLLVTDCECSEWPCLYTSRELARVQEIVGEYHERHDPKPFADVGKPYRIESLREYLQTLGFAVTIDSKGPGMGLFRASRGA